MILKALPCDEMPIMKFTLQERARSKGQANNRCHEEAPMTLEEELEMCTQLTRSFEEHRSSGTRHDLDFRDALQQQCPGSVSYECLQSCVHM